MIDCGFEWNSCCPFYRLDFGRLWP